MTPNDIEVLIHYHVSPTKHPRHNAPAVIKAIQMFLDTEMLFEQNGIYCTTDKGAAHIAQLCNLPLPTKQFLDHNGFPIKPRT